MLSAGALLTISGNYCFQWFFEYLFSVIVYSIFMVFIARLLSFHYICRHNHLYNCYPMRHILPLILLLSFALPSPAQMRVEVNDQQHFSSALPAGDYSGITWLGGDRYAVVSDKDSLDGFYLWELRHDSVSGRIEEVRNLGFRASSLRGRDAEGIAWLPTTGTILVSGEGDNAVREYTLDGQLTGRTLTLPDAYSQLPTNERVEALTYNDSTRTVWICNETKPITLAAYQLTINDTAASGDSLPEHTFELAGTYAYTLDEPVGSSASTRNYAHGVGTLAALDNGHLLVLEREFYVPKKGIGAWVACKLYEATIGEDSTVTKTLLTQWRTRLTLTGRSLANYEGMTLGPRLSDGSQLLVLVADSQHQYMGLLRDWLKTGRLYEGE